MGHYLNKFLEREETNSDNVSATVIDINDGESGEDFTLANSRVRKPQSLRKLRA